MLKFMRKHSEFALIKEDMIMLIHLARCCGSRNCMKVNAELLLAHISTLPLCALAVVLHSSS